MITLTIECSRCGKTFSQDMTNKTLANDMVREFGFVYAHNGKSNVVICIDCERKYKDLQDRLTTIAQTELCEFFCCDDKGAENGNNGGTEVG